MLARSKKEKMKFTLLALLSAMGLAGFAQNNFHDEIVLYGHKYKTVINTDLYAKWIITEEKDWYLAPDSTTSHLMTDIQWSAHLKEIKAKGFNEISSLYYWNPNTRTVVFVEKERHKNGMLHVSTEYGTDIR